MAGADATRRMNETKKKRFILKPQRKNYLIMRESFTTLSHVMGQADYRRQLCRVKLSSVRLESQTNMPEESITLRPATEDDQEFLLELYKHSRGDDLRGLGWSEDRIGEFLEMQYEAHQNFLDLDYPGVEDQIVMSAGTPVGHLTID